MNSEDTYEAVRAGVAEALEKAESSRRIMRIADFDAVDDDDAPLRVVGIVDHGEDELSFICLATVEDGEMSPVIRGSVYRPVNGSDIKHNNWR
ncbi:hypothetical protein ACLI1C_12055 [Devosia sp. XGJD_8]|uniref:hypothetical protein n=1 Tax=Devosia sp. XGJD_8 TaxID=3391187 RepID=UPI003984D38B